MKTKDIKKKLMLLSILLFGVWSFISCGTSHSPCGSLNASETATECQPEPQRCQTTSECRFSNQYCDQRYGHCTENVCLNKEIYSCGKGTCVPGDNPDTPEEEKRYHCICDEDAVHSRALFCVPTCDGFSSKCEEFDESIGGGTTYHQCNMELGRCDNRCKGEGSCDDGYYCSQRGSCIINQN